MCSAFSYGLQSAVGRYGHAAGRAKRLVVVAADLECVEGLAAALAHIGGRRYLQFLHPGGFGAAAVIAVAVQQGTAMAAGYGHGVHLVSWVQIF